MSEIEPKTSSHAAFLEKQAARVAGIRDELIRLYPEPVNLVLELGCGHGHYLTAYAEAHPEEHCLGLDIVSKRIRKANAKRDKRKLSRLQFIKAEVREFMMALPNHIHLERIFILFPDPWPKKRHSKNRIIQTQLLDDLAKHARPATALHFRTDDENNFVWGMEVVASHPEWEIRDDQEWPFENPSFFQDLFTSYESLTALFAGADS
jgi:tRNA (guanine-N7-)-methyltransferase